MPAGRPSKYTPDVCEKVIEWGKQGKSKAWMCSKLGISWNGMLLWEAAHPEFVQALEEALIHSQAHWEDLGQDNLKTQGFQTAIWSRSMAARFPKHWREKTAHVGGDEGDNPIKSETTLMGADEFARRIARLSAGSSESEGDSESQS